MKQKRGFVGPLGDDLPSIFPIIAAVLLFVGTLVYANGLVTGKNRTLETRQAGLGLSYIVTEKGLIQNQTEFEKKTCDNNLKKYALSNHIQFVVTIKRYCVEPPGQHGIRFYYPRENPAPQEARLSPTYLEKTRTESSDPNEVYGHTWTYCTNVPNPRTNEILKVPADAVTFTYPVAVPCAIIDGLPTNGLGLINVIVWKERGKI